MEKAIVLAGAVLLWSGMVWADGAAVYQKCKGCHGAEGKGNAAIKVPAYDTSKSDADMIKVIHEGKGKMPSYHGKLTDPEIADVVKYIKGGLK
ncbi:MAG: cytochrome c [Deltaproteobacteria bacterium]|nr:cytochrome c [Deltaproteobacteria bacterium]